MQWMAPELCKPEVQIAQKYMNADRSSRESIHSAELFSQGLEHTEYSMTVDQYAFGIMMFEMTAHDIPWSGQDQLCVFERVIAGERPQLNAQRRSEVPKAWCELMEVCDPPNF